MCFSFSATHIGKSHEFIHSGMGGIWNLRLLTRQSIHFWNKIFNKWLKLVLLFLQYSNSEKAFLFDVVSKIYIATDSSPVDMQSYELCCDMIDVVIDVSCIYGYVLYSELSWFYLIIEVEFDLNLIDCKTLIT